MQFVRRSAAEDAQVLCPCRSCLNREQQPLGTVESHLLVYGMASTYDRWVYHGEPLHAEAEPEPEAGPDADSHHVDEGNDFVQDDPPAGDGFEEEDENEDDRIPELLKEFYNSEPQGDRQKTIFAEMLEEAKRPASDGGKLSRFSFTVKLLHAKSFYRMTNVQFNAILRIMTLQYPDSEIPKSYDEALSIISRLGLGYVSIHVCPNNCVLFRKQFANYDKCPKCDASRWKNGDAKKRIPAKVLRQFLLIPRLEWMFISKKQSEEVQWHKLNRKAVEGELSHPANGKAWEELDKFYEAFAADPRNIKLGISADGFNPFGKMSTSYSMWPVFVMPYNLPPWACMDQSNVMMVLLIPDPDSPGKDFDVFMEPLVDELLLLWKGVLTYDAGSPEKFNLRAAVLWCIHDYPALHTLSGRTTLGYQSMCAL